MGSVSIHIKGVRQGEILRFLRIFAAIKRGGGRGRKR